ncbi:ABC transporter substrate-binding protein [Kribbella sp. NPDC051620]|uniref:ABC transporter substrate-binding protein n=1 Tax=Kribbella sp. NPDC051620 TaxID=3364120 RepID=UPI0037BCDBBA
MGVQWRKITIPVDWRTRVMRQCRQRWRLTPSDRRWGSAWRRRNAVVVAVALTTTLVAGCSSGSAASGGSGQASGALSILSWAKPADTISTDPHVDAGGNDADWEMYNLVYNNLVTLDTAQRVVPALATKWVQESPTQYLFDIRPGVKFSNGRLLTVNDVIDSLKRIMDPKLATSWAGRLNVKSAAAVGTDQVRVTLAKPNSTFLVALAMPMVAILPMKELQSGAFDPEKELIGTGPYVVVNHVKGQSWRLKRNPDYWGPQPKAAEIDIKIMPEVAARIAALKAGTAQITTFDQPDTIKLLQGTNTVTTVDQNQNLYFRLDVNAKSSIFADRRVREALALSINRANIANLALAGVGAPTAAIVPNFGVCDPSSVPFGQTDTAKARDLVSAAGATGKSVTILVPSGVGGGVDIAQVLKQDVEKSGLKVKIEQIENGPWSKRIYSGPPSDFDFTISYSGNYADPTMILGNFSNTTAPYAKGYQVEDPALDSLIGKAQAVPAGPDRNKLLDQVCQRIAQNANVIPLVIKARFVAYRNDKIVAEIGKVEGYSVPLRGMPQYSAK